MKLANASPGEKNAGVYLRRRDAASARRAVERLWRWLIPQPRRVKEKLMSAEDLDAMIEAAARVGYETIVQTQGMFINAHPWDQEPEELRRDWRAVARAMYPILSQ